MKRIVHCSNTLADFGDCLKSLASGVIVDVSMTSDNVLIVSTENLLDGSQVSMKSWDELKSVIAPGYGRLATLEEVLLFFSLMPLRNKPHFELHLVIHAPLADNYIITLINKITLAEKLYETLLSKSLIQIPIDDRRSSDSTSLQIKIVSSDRDILATLRQLDSTLFLSLMVSSCSNLLDMLDFCSKYVLNDICLEKRLLLDSADTLGAALLSRCHREKLTVTVENVNNPVEGLLLRKMGVDSLVSDILI